MAQISVHIDVQGIGAVKKMLHELRTALKPDTPVVGVVGYTAGHAVIVHEIGPPNRIYRNGKQHKYLEGPAREYKKEIVKKLGEGLRGREKRVKSMHDVCQFLKKKSQDIVPVDTGELHDSAFIRVY